MTKKELKDQILYDKTGMLVENHPSIATAMEKYHQANLKILGISDVDILLPNDYDSGLLNDYGGGNVEWWQDYIREEVARCNGYWRDYLERSQGNER